MSEQHPLARRDALAFGELQGEPFLALPETAGPLPRSLVSQPARPRRQREVVASLTPSATNETEKACRSRFSISGRSMICRRAAQQFP